MEQIPHIRSNLLLLIHVVLRITKSCTNAFAERDPQEVCTEFVNTHIYVLACYRF